MKVADKEFGFSQFFKPTPKNIARLGWSIFITAQTAAATFVYFEQEGVAATIAIVGCIGLFLSNFFGNGNQSNQENIQ